VRCFFLSFRDRTASVFSDLFESTGETPEALNARAGFAKRWGWYAIIYQLAGGVIQNLEAVTTLPLYQCLMWVTYETDKARLEAQLARQNSR
jgi:hypothetical protein